MLSDTDLAAIKERAEKATKGPWAANPKGPLVAIGAPTPAEYKMSAAILAVHCPSKYGLVPQGILFVDDANFVAHARTDIPALLREIDRLKAEARSNRPADAGKEGE